MKNNKSNISGALLNAMAVMIFPFCIITLEAVLFHLLIIVSNYIHATTVISLAMFGISLGGVLSFYFLRGREVFLTILASLVFAISIPLSYFSIVRLDSFTFPWFLILPFFSGSFIVSAIFARHNSHIIYFLDLSASALGVLFPVFFVAQFKSEGTLLFLMLFPMVFILFYCLRVKNLFFRIVLQSLTMVSIVVISMFWVMNVNIPLAINGDEYRKKIEPMVDKKIERDILKKVYAYDVDKDIYRAQTDDKYYLEMAKNIINKTDFYPFIMDLSCNYRPSYSAEKNFKIYTNRLKNYTFLYSKDNLMGRVEYITKSERDFLYINNGSFYDRVIFKDRGLKNDARFPNYLRNANVFIMGASADGIVKSVKRLPGKAKISGVEFNPIIHETMSQGFFFEKSERAYENTIIHRVEGRAYLRSTDEKFDMITHMNNHAEHGAVCSLAPEYLHTMEAIEEMLEKLTDRGLLVYEEILWSNRTEWFFYKFVNTIVHALRNMGIEKPWNHILIYKWDYWNYSKPAVRSIVVKRLPFSAKERDKLRENLKLYIENKKIPLMSSKKPILAFPGKIIPGIVGKMIGGVVNEYQIQLPNYIWHDDFEKKVLACIHNEDDREFVLSLYKKYPKVEVTRGFDFTSTVYNFKQGRYIIKKWLLPHDIERYSRILDKTNYSYKMNIDPITDDKPFPFNVYEEKKELFGTMKIVAFLSLLIFLPVLILAIMRFRSHGGSIFRHTLFFSSVGFGFMVVEIVLMQFFQRFIGIPVYSVIVTLGGLLFFSGLGSMASTKWKRGAVLLFTAAISPVLAIYLYFLDDAFSFLSVLTFSQRPWAALGLIFPLAFIMGIPFPKAMEQIKGDISPEYATLMYAISGAAGTIATTVALYMNISFGFSFTFAMGMFAYAMGAILLFFVLKEKSQA